MTDDPTEPMSFEDYSAYMHSAYEAGARAALLNMFWLCVEFQRPIPDWAGKRFDEAFSYVLMGGARSWDDVFGSPHAAVGKHLRSVRLKNQKFAVYQRVREIQDREKVPIGEGLFERVGKELNIGRKTVVSDLYGQVARLMRRFEEAEIERAKREALADERQVREY
jgi:hypothetical protein